MQIRLANVDDIDQLIRLRWDFTLEFNDSLQSELFDDFEKSCCEFLQKEISGDRWVIWVAEMNDKIVSHIFLHIINKMPRPGDGSVKFGYVTNVYTIPEYRNQNIGSQIHLQVQQWAIENNMEFLIVWPSSNSVQFYEKNGFGRCAEAMEKYL